MHYEIYSDRLPLHIKKYIKTQKERYASLTIEELDQEIHTQIKNNLDIHEKEAINLNPATNVMNPKAEEVLAKGLGSRPSLGYPGDKYEMGLEAIEKIEIITGRLACEVFNAKYAEIRVASGTMANLYAFMATCLPGESIIVPPASIGGHVTHHHNGTAGLYKLDIYQAPIDAKKYTIDIDQLHKMAKDVKPKLITVGSSLNLVNHPLTDIRQIADDVGAKVLYDAAHLCGLIAGKAWQQPLEEGAHIMTMSTYKSLGGPPSGLVLTNDNELAQRIDSIAFPGLTANFDAAKSASLAITLLDWKEFGTDYASMMKDTARTLAAELAQLDIPVFESKEGFTQSHQFAIHANNYGGGQNAAKHLRKANLLTCGIGLPAQKLPDMMNGLRFGTPEIVRRGMNTQYMPQLAGLIAKALKSDTPQNMSDEVTNFRNTFHGLDYVRS